MSTNSSNRLFNISRKDMTLSIGLSVDNNTCGIHVGDAPLESGFFVPASGKINQFPHIVIAEWTFCPVQKVAAKVIFSAIKESGVAQLNGENTQYESDVQNPDPNYYLDIPRLYVSSIVEIVRRVVKGLSIMEFIDGSLSSRYIESIKSPQSQQETSLKILRDRDFLKVPTALIMGKNMAVVHMF